KYRFEPGTENYPANNISYQQAVDYTKWLSKQTGRENRLPNRPEAEILYQGEPRRGDNTLDESFRYRVSVERALRIWREVLNLLPLGALIQDAGSGPPVSNPEPVFGLRGNVAEYIQGDGGREEVRGASADTPASGGLQPGPA